MTTTHKISKTAANLVKVGYIGKARRRYTGDIVTISHWHKVFGDDVARCVIACGKAVDVWDGDLVVEK